MSVTHSLKQALESLSKTRAGSIVVPSLFSVGMSLLARHRVRTTRHEIGWRQAFASGRVVWSPHLDLVTPARLIAEVETYYTPIFAIEEGDTVLDAGASNGTFALVASDLVGPSGRVIAIEAEPESFELLRRTIAESGASNVTCLNVALGPSEGIVTMEKADDFRLSRVSAGSTSGGAEIRQQTIESIVLEQGLSSISFLKMNIEGAEQGALDGARPVKHLIRRAAISAHDFLVAETGDEWYRTKDSILEFFGPDEFEVRLGNELTSEPGALHDYVYARSILHQERP